jgi:hypothetical protein
MAIEDLLREAAAKGLTHLTLYPVDSQDGKSVYWNARATPSTGHMYVQVANFDPVKAVELVLEALPRARKRAAPNVTAAVKDPPGETTPTETEPWMLKP